MAKITGYSIDETTPEEFQTFEIIQSSSNSQANLLLTPDFAMCEDCLSELYDPNNRRYQYPFITCTNCGPRYSITRRLPYDRHTTTMAAFRMCLACETEYHDPMNRRYYSQTNSCPDCAIEMMLFKNGKLHYHFTNLDEVTGQWKNGKIVAIKGIGGYLLTCDATNPEPINRLRHLKNRPAKPFALMYPHIEMLKQDVELHEKIINELNNTSSPIVLIPLKNQPQTPLAMNAIAPGLHSIGVMLPYTPLYHLLLNKFNRPIIATSGNISGNTIIYQDADAIEKLSNISDMILMNNREIVIPQDDSVVRFSYSKKQKIIIRRSRGLAPSYINPNLKLPEKSILAFGAMMKSTFTLLHNKTIHISQYLGSTDNFHAETNYINTLRHFTQLFKPEIDQILIDMHPGYFTHRYGKEFSEKYNIPYKKIQHHKAHFFAVMAENDLLIQNDRVLGVIWDGTGLGDDNHIWGGEFFTYHRRKVERIGHIGEFPFILGDKMVQEPRISALIMSKKIKNQDIIQNKFTAVEWKIYNKLLKTNKLKSTSVGRLFDAVSSILLSHDKQSYEGEAAIYLEDAAFNAIQKKEFSLSLSYLKNNEIPENLPEFIMEKIWYDLKNGEDRNFIAAKFHITLAHYIQNFARKTGISHVAFSGGVFQNQLLTDLIITLMQNEFNLYFHKNLSPNDENISFGQLMYDIYAME